MGNQVDTEVCLLAQCPFVDKIDGYCARALALRKRKSDVCISTVSIRVKRDKK